MLHFISSCGQFYIACKLYNYAKIFQILRCYSGSVLQGTGMLVYILIGWLFKTGVEVVYLSITYRVIAKMKQIENIDTYDNKTDFTPFRVYLD